MANKYKLCRVLTTGHTTVQPIDVNGDPYGDTLLTYESDATYQYAIYENWGDENDEDWNEHSFYDEDFEKARDEYNRLVKEAEDDDMYGYIRPDEAEPEVGEEMTDGDGDIWVRTY